MLKRILASLIPFLTILLFLGIWGVWTIFLKPQGTPTQPMGTLVAIGAGTVVGVAIVIQLYRKDAL